MNDFIENMTFSDVESKRFNANIYRATMADFDACLIKKELESKKADILILRLPTSTKATHYKLLESGYEILHADSLVYYSCNLKKYQPHGLKNILEFETVNKNNCDLLDRIIPVIFEGYQNHYFSNPFFGHKEINEGYVEWARSYIEGTEGRISWLVKSDEGEIAGFATCSFDTNSSECEGILYGVMPEFAGRGIYSDIIRFTQNYFKDKEFETMRVSTQLQNYAVQKVWNREGFALEKSYETYHINSMLNIKNI